MNYRVLARRYRPSTFSDIVGQKHVVRTLLNAIKSDRIAHAYLFSGARGVGKTSAARVFAKTLNCPNISDFEPCCTCDTCKAISEGEDIDVIEMDGASNRGIDDIRNLRDNVSFRPALSPYKIYIIDEVHMLTREAFNALLKTLEEPPAYIKFVFCTTEPERIPATILSRCQRFDFHRLTIDEIQGQLVDITNAEGFSISDEALNAVARYARGGLRDSISVLEQLFSFSEEQISIDDVRLVLGAVSPDKIRDLVFACARADSETAITCLISILDSGRDTLEVLDQIVGFLRDCLIAVECPKSTSLLTGWITEQDTKRDEFSLLSSSKLMMMINYLYWARPFLKEDSAGRVPIEIAIIRMAHVGDIFEIPKILKALGNTGKAILTEEAAGGLKEVKVVTEVAKISVSPPPIINVPESNKPATTKIPTESLPDEITVLDEKEVVTKAEKPPKKEQERVEKATATEDSEPEKPKKIEKKVEFSHNVAGLIELWYSFLSDKLFRPIDDGAFRKCSIVQEGSAFFITPPSTMDMDFFHETIDEFKKIVEPHGFSVSIRKPEFANAMPDLFQVMKEPVIEEALDLFPDSRIQGIDKRKESE